MSPSLRGAVIAGAVSIICYGIAAFAPLPDAVSRLCAFAFGPLFAVGFIGLYHYLTEHRTRILTQIGCVFGIAAGVLLTAMLVMQIGNQMWLSESLASAGTEAVKQTARVAWRAVDQTQLLLDVVMDIFLCTATVLLGIAMSDHPQLGKIYGWSGIAFAIVLLVLNLQTFPVPPANAGSFDAGPLVALWYLVIFIRVAWTARRVQPA